MTALFHIVERAAWEAVDDDYRPGSLATEGFVHCSFADQVEASANRHFAGADDLCVVEFDADSLTAAVRVEDSYGTGTAFPHVYGAIPKSAAVAIHPLTRGSDGRWRFSPGRRDGGASPDR